MIEEIEIKSRRIGPNQPLFIIAECGVTCNYELDIAKQLIDVVKDCGGDAIKFIFWFPEEIMSDKSIDYSYETKQGTKTENMYEMLNDLRFTLDEWKEIKSYADKKDVIMFSTVNSPGGIKYAEELGLEAYKLSSWDYNYHPLWREIASKGKPVLIDTGPVTTLEVSKVMNLLEEAGNNQHALLHCFHTEEPSEMNMRAIPYMKDAFNTLVGYSSPNRKDDMDVTAISLGGCILEKRLTLDRDLPGHHHILSKEPEEFSDYVNRMRNVKKALGKKELNPSQADMEERKKWFRHIVATEPIEEGETITRDQLTGKRPEDGVSPEFLDIFVGRTVQRDIEYNEAIHWEDV
ncbi:MAG: N-acetylneuraminate synthase family protein [bacterium]